MREHQLVLAGQRVELVGRGDKILAGDGGDGGGDLLVEALGGVQTRAHRGAAQRQFLQLGQRKLQHLSVLFQRASPTGDLLGETNGGRVLQMRASGLNHAFIFLLQAPECGDQRIDGGEELILNGDDGGNVHRGGEGIIGGLAHIDVVIGMQQLFAGQLVAAIGDDLVGVHVALRARARLPHHQGEVIVERAGHHLIAGLGDGGKLFVSHLLGAQLVVGDGRRLLQHAECMRDLAGHGFQPYADEEIFMAAFGLRRPVFVGRHLDLAHGIVLNAVLHCFNTRSLKN